MLARSRAKWAFALMALTVLLKGEPSSADGISMRYKEGPLRGFLTLRTEDGKIAAVGELVQVEWPDRIVSRLTFHFKDGSLHDETTEFTQQGRFRLLSDHLVQKGPSFKLQIDAFLNASTGQFTARYQDREGHQKEITHHLKVPADISNGMVWTLAKNIDIDTPEMSVSWIAASPKPRLIKIRLIQQGRDTFSVAGSQRKAIHFTAKVEIPGAAGWIAKITGKRIPDTQLWILGGDVPLFLKFEGPLYDGGPIWRIEPASPTGPQSAPAAREK